MKTKSHKTDKFYRTTISIPKPIKQRMARLEKNGVRVNWSSIATDAFIDALEKLESGNHAHAESLSEKIARLESKVKQLEKK